jgi:hypothetical protein
MERETISTLGTISTEEVRKWAALIEEQNTRYAQMQSDLHRQEIAMTDPGTTYIVIALIAVLAAIGFIAWMIRDSNAEAARTLSDAVSVLPSLRAALQDARSKTLAQLPNEKKEVEIQTDEKSGNS